MILYKKETKTKNWIIIQLDKNLFSPYHLDSKIIKVDGLINVYFSERENEGSKLYKIYYLHILKVLFIYSTWVFNYDHQIITRKEKP